MSRAINVRGYARITVSSTAIGLATPTSGDAFDRGKHKRAIITFEDNPCRWLANGTAPTSTTGHLVRASSSSSDTLEFMSDDYNYEDVLAAIQFIRKDAADCEAKVTYFD